MLSSHSPISAKEANAAKMMSAARQPPKRSTISVEAAMVPTQVSQSRASFSAMTSHSAKARKPSRSAKMRFGFAAVRSSRSQPCRSSRRAGSWCQTSELGQWSSPFRRKYPTSISPTIAPTWAGLLRQRELGAGPPAAPRSCR